MAEKYTVKTGDTLNKIAARYGYSDYKAAGISGFENPDTIAPGLELTIGNPTPAASANKSLNASQIVDQPGVVIPNGVVNPNAPQKILDGATTPPPTPEETVAANTTEKRNLSEEQRQLLLKQQAARPDISAMIVAKSAELGIPMALEEIQTIIGETSDLRTQINQLNSEEATMLENTTGQGRGIPLSILEGEQGKIQRQFAIRRNALSAELGARTATIQALQGNISLAQKTIETAVSAKIYEAEQKVQDYKNLYDFNGDIIESLDEETRKILDRQYTEAQQELKDKREDRDKVAQLMIDNPNAGITLDDSVDEAALKVSKKGGSLAARQEARLGRTAGGSNGLTPTQSTEANAAVSLYDGTLQDAMKQGATPEQAVQAAVTIAANQGTKLDLIQQKALLDRAKGIKNGGITPAAPSGQQTVTYRNPRTGQTKELVFTGDPLEDEITRQKASGVLTNSDVRDILRKRGYSPKQIAGSSVGGLIPSIGAYFFGI